jgi:hypothetical protein
MWTIPVMHDAASGTYTNNINQGVMPWGVTECIEVVDLVEDAGQYGMMAGGDSGTGNSSSSSLNLNDNTDGHHDDWYEAPVNLHTSAIGSFSSLVLGNSQIGFNVCGEGEAIQGGSSAIDNVSISFWVSGNQTPTAGDTIISLNTLFTNSNDGIGAYLTSNNPPKLRFFINKTQTASKYAEAELAAKQWNHVVLTYDRYGGSDNMKIYRDGTLSATNTLDEPISEVDKSLVVGRAGSTDGYYFSGLLTELSIFADTLDSSAVSGIYNNGAPNSLTLDQSYAPNDTATGAVPNLKMWHRLGGGRYEGLKEFEFPANIGTYGFLGGRAVYDESVNGNHGILQGSKWDTSSGIVESTVSEYPSTINESDWGPK